MSKLDQKLITLKMALKTNQMPKKEVKKENLLNFVKQNSIDPKEKRIVQL